MDEKRVAIVTGGGSGIGLAISERLAADGHAVAVLDLDAAAANAAAAAITADGGRAVGLEADVADRALVFAAVDQVRTVLGRPTILVNNAGTGATFSRFLEIDARDMGAGPAGQPEWRLPLLPGRVARHDRGRVGPDRQHLVVEHARRAGAAQPLRVLQVGAERVDQVPGPRVRAQGDHRQRHPARASSTRPMLRASEERGEFGPGGVDDAVARTPVRRAGRARRHRGHVPRSCAATRPGTSRARSSGSTAGATPEPGCSDQL